MMFFGWLWLLLVPLAIVAVVLAARGGDRGGDSRRRAAEDALARRYADGEIDEQEYRERSATLTRMHPQRRDTSWWLLAIALGAIALLITGLLWGGMGSGLMWNTMAATWGGRARARSSTFRLDARESAISSTTTDGSP